MITKYKAGKILFSLIAAIFGGLFFGFVITWVGLAMLFQFMNNPASIESWIPEIFLVVSGISGMVIFKETWNSYW